MQLQLAGNARFQHPQGAAVMALAALLALWPVSLSSAAETVTVRAPDTMAARVLACASCHGAEGQGTTDEYIPRLAGKPSGYLLNQLIAFRDGRRKYPPMRHLLVYLPDAFLAQMADYYAAQNPQLPAAVASGTTADIQARGEMLVRHGDAQKNIPACSGCHGPEFTGQEPGIPGLLGLRATYISAQLGAWRYGTRTALAPDCMQVIAGLLGEDDVRAIAAWLASHPAPGDTVPAPRGSLPMPFACGSQPN